jgi:glycoside/pentoside/hexuronide:cation symporter, GPH family
MAIATITAGLPFAAIYLIFDGEASFLSPMSKNLGILSFLFAAFVIGAINNQAALLYHHYLRPVFAFLKPVPSSSIKSG